MPEQQHSFSAQTSASLHAAQRLHSSVDHASALNPAHQANQDGNLPGPPLHKAPPPPTQQGALLHKGTQEGQELQGVSLPGPPPSSPQAGQEQHGPRLPTRVSAPPQLSNSVLDAGGAAASALLEQQDVALPGPPVLPLKLGAWDTATANSILPSPPQQVCLAVRLFYATSTLLGKIFCVQHMCLKSDRKNHKARS